MREELEKAVAFAAETGSFSKLNITEHKKNVCVFGLGKFFEEAFDAYSLKEKLEVNVLCDNDTEKWGKKFKGIPCISPQELNALDDTIIIPLMNNPEALRGIHEQFSNIPYLVVGDVFFELLADMPRDIGWFKKNRILDVYDMLEDDESKEIFAKILCNRIALGRYEYPDLFSDGEYFAHHIFELAEDEVFLDCGAYNGDSVEKFINATGGKFLKIYSFEMAEENFKKLVKKVESLGSDIISRVHCFHAGVWDEYGTIAYGKEERGNLASFSVCKTENMKKSEAVRIDDILGSKRASLIKMDIEGAELRALHGAERTIKKYKPKLAICLYHKLSDFWEIPTYLNRIFPNYRFSVRHHGRGVGGTVLYAF
jgi:FkbM family methyltransferase